MKIAVFCGSRLPENDIYRQEAQALAQYFVDHDIELIYGGAQVGIMGVIANTMLELGGHVIGIMPEILVQKEIAHPNLSAMHVVKDMSERKNMMNDMADAFIAFPGGCGTMDEIFEVITLNQIGQFNKPVGFVNVDGYYDGIATYLDKAVQIGFTASEDAQEILFESSSIALINKLKAAL